MATLEEIMAMANADRARSSTEVLPSVSTITPSQAATMIEQVASSPYRPGSSLMEQLSGIGAPVGAENLELPIQTRINPQTRGELGWEVLQGGIGSIADALTLNAYSPLAARGWAGIESLLGGGDYERNIAQWEKDLATRKQIYREAAAQVPGGTFYGIPISDVTAGLAAPIALGRATQGMKVLPRLVTETALGAGAGATSAALDVETKPEERKQAIETSTYLGAILSGGGSLLGSALSGLAPVATKEGARIQRGSIGARQSDYQKVATRAGITDKELPHIRGALMETDLDIKPEQLETITKRNLDEMLAEGELGTSRVPSNMIAKVDSKLDLLREESDGVIREFDLKNKSDLPEIPFKNAYEWIESGRAGKKADTFLQDILDLESRIALGGKKSLAFIQAEKRALAKQYSMGDDLDAEFGRRLYSDVKTYIEGRVPAIKGINKQQQKLMSSVPILRRQLAKEEAFDSLAALQRLTYTTGGILAPIIGGATIGASTGDATTGAVRGAAVGLGLKAATSAQGRRIIANALTGTGRIAERIVPSNAADVLARAGRAIVTALPTTAPTDPTVQVIEGKTKPVKPALSETQRQRLQQLRSSSSAPGGAMTTPPSKQDISAIIAAKPPIIQAMVQAESSGNPNAIGPKTKSGRAQGLMQLIPSTAKALGVTDSLDPQQNIDAGEKYFDQMLKKFGSQELALAAYNWGPGNLSKAIDRLEAKNQKPTWSNLLRYTSVPEETESYVAAVLGNLKRG